MPGNEEGREFGSAGKTAIIVFYQLYMIRPDIARAISAPSSCGVSVGEACRAALCNNSNIMSTRKTITLHLEPREYAQLKAKARRESMDPDALVRFLVDDVLRNDEDAAEQHKQAMHDALDRLAATMPSFDAEKLVREGRDEFDKRSST